MVLPAMGNYIWWLEMRESTCRLNSRSCLFFTSLAWIVGLISLHRFIERAHQDGRYNQLECGSVTNVFPILEHRYGRMNSLKISFSGFLSGEKLTFEQDQDCEFCS